MKSNSKKWLVTLLIAVSLLAGYQVINIGINAATTIQEHYREKVDNLYIWDANLLVLFESYIDKPDNREDILIKIIEWSAVAESINNDMTYPYLIPNVHPANYKVPYRKIINDARMALLNEDDFDITEHKEFINAKIIYNLHYDAILGINRFQSEEFKAIVGTGVDKVKLNYFTKVLIEGNKISFNLKQKEYLKELFYELNLQKYYGESNVWW